MGQCAESGCKRAEIGSSGKCHKHGGRVVAAPTRHAVFSLQQDDETFETNRSADEAKTWLQAKCDQAQSANAPAIIGAMQDGEGSGRTKKSPSTSIGIVYHASQGAAGKAGALTAFWTEQTSGVVTIVAIGAHSGPSSYNISWAGKTWKWGSATSAAKIQ